MSCFLNYEWLQDHYNWQGREDNIFNITASLYTLRPDFEILSFDVYVAKIFGSIFEHQKSNSLITSNSINLFIRSAEKKAAKMYKIFRLANSALIGDFRFLPRRGF